MIEFQLKTKIWHRAHGYYFPGTSSRLRVKHGEKNVLTTKDTRKLNHALNRFFTPKAWRIPTSIEDFSWSNSLARELRLNGNRILLMTDVGMESFQTITTILDAVDISTGFGLVPFSDYAATKKKNTELYKQRSTAVHRASYRHVST